MYATMKSVVAVERQKQPRHIGLVPAVRRQWLLLVAAYLLSALSAWTQAPAPENTGESGAPETAQPTSASEFVAVPDLAAQLKKIDPNAVVEWDGRRLRIAAKNQKFTLFLSSSDVVINGTPQKVSSPLRVYRGELYVPQDAVDLLATELAKSAPEAAPTGTPTPPTPSPTPTPASVLTPSPSASPTPTPTASPTPQSTAQPTPTKTPTMAETLPQPTPSPTPRPTSHVAIEIKPSAAKATPPLAKVSQAPSGDAFARLLHERDQIAHAAITPLSRAELEQRARSSHVEKIILDPDEGITADASSEIRRQSHLTLQLAMKIKMRLTGAGYRVELTREDPQYVSLAQKLQRIRGSQGDLLVSLRSGTHASASVSGARIFYPSPTTDYAVGKPELASGSDTVPVEQTYLPFAEKSKQVASVCLAALKTVGGTGDAATMLPAPLFLGRRAPMPSVHLVVGYLSNPSDRARLLDEVEQDRLANALAQAIIEFASGAKATSQESAKVQRRGLP
ncbi:MAG: N-acetylmuramoyl-L-alanine amidase [Candidatus Sumerlaeaceae bacterium]|jgi:N-acetylmuramoyl-L-alanine amidase